MMMNSTENISNLLNALHQEDRDLLIPHLQPVRMEAGTVLYEPGDIVKFAYFPCGPTLISFMVLLDDARGVETAMVGREGAVGGIVSHGSLPSYSKAIVQFPGQILRIESTELEKAKMASHKLSHLFACYSDCLLAQVFQSVACNATHTIEQRSAKWLLAAIERTGNLSISLTQEQLAGMLGVGRSYVARVIGGLKESGTLETARGKLHIREPEKLKSLACNCNELVKHHFDEVLRGVYPKDIT